MAISSASYPDLSCQMISYLSALQYDALGQSSPDSISSSPTCLSVTSSSSSSCSTSDTSSSLPTSSSSSPISFLMPSVPSPPSTQGFLTPSPSPLLTLPFQAQDTKALNLGLQPTTANPTVAPIALTLNLNEKGWTPPPPPSHSQLMQDQRLDCFSWHNKRERHVDDAVEQSSRFSTQVNNTHQLAIKSDGPYQFPTTMNGQPNALLEAMHVDKDDDDRSGGSSRGDGGVDGEDDPTSLFEFVHLQTLLDLSSDENESDPQVSDMFLPDMEMTWLDDNILNEGVGQTTVDHSSASGEWALPRNSIGNHVQQHHAPTAFPVTAIKRPLEKETFVHPGFYSLPRAQLLSSIAAPAAMSIPEMAMATQFSSSSEVSASMDVPPSILSRKRSLQDDRLLSGHGADFVNMGSTAVLPPRSDPNGINFRRYSLPDWRPTMETAGALNTGAETVMAMSHNGYSTTMMNTTPATSRPPRPTSVQSTFASNTGQHANPATSDVPPGQPFVATGSAFGAGPSQGGLDFLGVLPAGSSSGAMHSYKNITTTHNPDHALLGLGAMAKGGPTPSSGYVTTCTSNTSSSFARKKRPSSSAVTKTKRAGALTPVSGALSGYSTYMASMYPSPQHQHHHRTGGLGAIPPPLQQRHAYHGLDPQQLQRPHSYPYSSSPYPTQQPQPSQPPLPAPPPPQGPSWHEENGQWKYAQYLDRSNRVPFSPQRARSGLMGIGSNLGPLSQGGSSAVAGGNGGCGGGTAGVETTTGGGAHRGGRGGGDAGPGVSGTRGVAAVATAAVLSGLNHRGNGSSNHHGHSGSIGSSNGVHGSGGMRRPNPAEVPASLLPPDHFIFQEALLSRTLSPGRPVYGALASSQALVAAAAEAEERMKRRRSEGGSGSGTSGGAGGTNGPGSSILNNLSSPSSTSSTSERARPVVLPLARVQELASLSSSAAVSAAANSLSNPLLLSSSSSLPSTMATAKMALATTVTGSASAALVATSLVREKSGLVVCSADVIPNEGGIGERRDGRGAEGGAGRGGEGRSIGSRSVPFASATTTPSTTSTTTTTTTAMRTASSVYGGEYAPRSAANASSPLVRAASVATGEIGHLRGHAIGGWAEMNNGCRTMRLPSNHTASQGALGHGSGSPPMSSMSSSSSSSSSSSVTATEDILLDTAAVDASSALFAQCLTRALELPMATGLEDVGPNFKLQEYLATFQSWSATAATALPMGTTAAIVPTASVATRSPSSVVAASIIACNSNNQQL